MKKEKGSITVFMSVMLLILVLFEYSIILLAKAIASMSVITDASAVTQGSLYACYNYPIRDAYGITVYTKSEAYLSAKGTEIFNESVNPLSLKPGISRAGNMLNITGSVDAYYESGDALSVQGNYIHAIVNYIKERDSLTHTVQTTSIDALVDNQEKIKQLKERFEQDIRDAANGVESYKDHGLTMDDEIVQLADTYDFDTVLSKRDWIYNGANADRLYLDIGAAYAYNNINAKSYGIAQVANEYWTDEQVVRTAIMTIDEMDSYYKTLQAAKTAIDNKSEAYYVAQYTTELFSAFRYYGETALSGNYYGSGDLVSINPFCEAEYLLYGDGDIHRASNSVKRLIFDSLYEGHLVDLMMNQPVDKQIIAYAMVLAEDDMSKVNMFADALYSATAANLAYDDLVTLYCKGEMVPFVAGNYNSGFAAYQDYMELFALIECCKNESAVVQRQLHVIEKNAANSSAEAKEFKIAKAYVDVNVEYGFTAQ